MIIKRFSIRHTNSWWLVFVAATVMIVSSAARANGAESAPAMLGVVPADQSGHVAVQELYVGGPAFAAGLILGDQILTVDGQPVSNTDELIAQIAAHQPNSRVDLLVGRNGWTKHFIVTLGSRADVIILSRIPSPAVEAPSPARPLRRGYIVRGSGYVDETTARNIIDPYYRALYTKFGPN